MRSSFNFIIFLFAFLQSGLTIAQNNLIVEGVIYDEYNYPIPYASVGIVEKNIGTIEELRTSSIQWYQYLFLIF